MVGKLNSIDEIARVQRSLVTRKQLLEADFTRWQIAGLLRSRALRVACPGVYATMGSTRSWEQDILAEVLSVGDGAVAFRASAARVWDFAHRPEDALQVLIKA